MICVAANYALAFLERGNINETVTVALITTILGTVIGYFVKSFNEKNSRNKYGVDEFGEKIKKSKSENCGNGNEES